jgi:hypothetical protein
MRAINCCLHSSFVTGSKRIYATDTTRRCNSGVQLSQLLSMFLDNRHVQFHGRHLVVQVTSTGTSACSMRHGNTASHDGDILTAVYSETGRDRRRSIFRALTTENHGVLTPCQGFLGLCGRLLGDVVCRKATAKEGSVSNTGVVIPHIGG